MGKLLDKSDQAFRTITEAAETLNLPAHVLRFWESKFKYIKPLKRGGGRRYYRPDDISLLRGIKFLLYTEGLTINGTQKLIKSKGVKSIIQLGAAKLNTSETLQRQFSSKREEIKITLGSEITEKQSRLIRQIDANRLSKIISNLESLKSSIEIRNNEIREIFSF